MEQAEEYVQKDRDADFLKKHFVDKTLGKLPSFSIEINNFTVHLAITFSVL